MSASTDTSLSALELLTASIAVILLSVFVAMSRDRIVSDSKEKQVLRSVAGEFRLVGAQGKRERTSSVFHERREVGLTDVELLTLTELFFSSSDALTDQGMNELRSLAEGLKGGEESLRIVLSVPEQILDEDGAPLVSAEERVGRLSRFLQEQGVPAFAVESEVAIAPKEGLSFVVQGPEARIRWK